MYFDYAATTQPLEEVLSTFLGVNRDFWANPQTLYRPGLRAEALLEQARGQVLSLLDADDGYRCVFTSGATESNNMAILGAARQLESRGRHLITSAVEHPSVFQVFRFLEQAGWELSVLPVNEKGAVEPETLKQAMRADTVLVSLMHVNNESGAINQIEQLGALVKEHGRAVFHVDAAQSVGKLMLSLKSSAVNLLSFSAHKFFGLKGSGALLIGDGIELQPLVHGGGQESGLRSGTGDPARAAALARALRMALEKREAAYDRVSHFRDRLIREVDSIPGAELNTARKGASPYIVNFSVAGVRPETILQALADKEMYISTVSACSARKTMESAVIRAMTGNAERAQSSLRISFGPCTTSDEVEALCRELGPTIELLCMKGSHHL